MIFSVENGRKNVVAVSLLLFALGVFCAIVLQTLWSSLSSCHKEFHLLNPTLPCEDAVHSEWDYEPLRDMLTRKKGEWKEAQKISHISVYFRDLSPGPRFGVGEYDEFHPASLAKVPIMIAYLHEADLDPGLLDQTLSFTGSLNTNPNLERSEESIQPNTPYSIRELLTKMIVYSDNYSHALLTRELNSPTPLSAYYTFRDLDVRTMMFAPKADYVSIQEYGNLFVILYNTGYLSKEMSQLALDLLSKATFTEGLVAGVPEGTRVAHKFGNRELENGEVQLHDCGIVYHPSTPYLLCVMTSGFDLTFEKEVIADVSRTVYEEVSALASK